jgi:peptide chain release factor 1
VTDHRLELTLYNLAAFMDGDLDPMIEPLMNHEVKRRLAAIET